MKRSHFILFVAITVVLFLSSCSLSPDNGSTTQPNNGSTTQPNNGSTTQQNTVTISIPLFSDSIDSGSKSIEKNFDESYDFYLDWIDPVICGFESREVSLGSTFEITLGGEQYSVTITEISSGVYEFTCSEEDVLIKTTVNQTLKTFSYFQAMRVHCDEKLTDPSMEWNYLTIVWGENLSFEDGLVQGRIDCQLLDPEQGFGNALCSAKASFFNTDSIRAVCFYDLIELDSSQSGITTDSLSAGFQELKAECIGLRSSYASEMRDNADLLHPIFYITPSMSHVLDESGPESTYTGSATLEGAASWISTQDKYSGWIL